MQALQFSKPHTTAERLRSFVGSEDLRIWIPWFLSADNKFSFNTASLHLERDLYLDKLLHILSD